jgi:hypothetical protein
MRGWASSVWADAWYEALGDDDSGELRQDVQRQLVDVLLDPVAVAAQPSGLDTPIAEVSRPRGAAER